MGLFSKKPIYRCELLERYRIDPVKDGCKLLGETEQHRIFLYKYRSNGSVTGEHLLRQEKASPKKVVYLGRAKKHYCVFHNKVFMMDRTFPHINFLHPKLCCTDIITGHQTEIDILSKETTREFVAGMVYALCQDCVESMFLQDDKVVLEVKRSESTPFTFHIQIGYENGEFTFTRVLPSGIREHMGSWTG